MSVMTEESGYTLAERVGAAVSLLAVLAFGFILADVLLGGRLTGRGGCGCGETAEEASDD